MSSAGSVEAFQVSVDVVLCQAALMFFPDRAAALHEMARVVAPGGTVAVQVWDRLEAQDGFLPLYAVLAEHGGQVAAELAGSYWVLGDLDLVSSLFEAAGLRITATRSRVGIARYDSSDEAVAAEVEATPLIERISEEVHRRILEDARAALAPFTAEDGRIELPLRGHLITARRRD